ncbi:BrnA antitoxin of type II toxin-antitoxin system [compost metagenome]
MALFHQIKRHDALEEARRQQEKAFSDHANTDIDGLALQRAYERGLLAPKVSLQEAMERRGRKPDPNAKKLLTLRIDPDVIDHFKATGEGWQTRMNEALRKAAGL